MKPTFLKALLLAIMPFFAFSQQAPYMLIGTYTSGKSEGIYVYTFNSQTGDFQYVSKAAASNPSFLAISPNKQYVYSVHEDEHDKGSISAFAFDQSNGSLRELNKQSSGGLHPCHVAVDKTGRYVIASNYTGGNFSVLPVNADGSLQPASQTIQHTGHGPNAARQDKPHVHSAGFSPDKKYLFVADLGTDRVMTYTFNAANGKVASAPTPFLAVTPGEGPRHFDFHPNGKWFYLVEELSGNVTACKYTNGKLAVFQTISAIPSGYTGPIGSADIHVSPDGRFVYASNRGESNTIAIFRVEPKSGRLTIAGHHSTLGKTPRNFSIDPSGNFLLVANQNSDNIVVLKRDRATGMLSETGKEIKVPNPVCIKWISEP